MPRRDTRSDGRHGRNLLALNLKQFTGPTRVLDADAWWKCEFVFHCGCRVEYYKAGQQPTVFFDALRSRIASYCGRPTCDVSVAKTRRLSREAVLPGALFLEAPEEAFDHPVIES